MTPTLKPELNRLLAALPEEVMSRILPEFELVAMPPDQIVHEVSGKLRYAYFPVTCIISKISNLINGDSAEIGVVGREGMVSVCLFMGGNAMPYLTVVRNPGFAYRIRSERIEAIFKGDIRVQKLFLGYTQALITQMAQTAVCNRHHQLEQRFCNFLLTSHDRMFSDEIIMTQERMAMLLGVRREGITEVASHLQDDGVIRYRRGKIAILNKNALKLSSCECYDVVNAEFERLIPHMAAVSKPPSLRFGFNGIRRSCSAKRSLLPDIWPTSFACGDSK